MGAADVARLADDELADYHEQVKARLRELAGRPLTPAEENEADELREEDREVLRRSEEYINDRYAAGAYENEQTSRRSPWRRGSRDLDVGLRAIHRHRDERPASHRPPPTRPRRSSPSCCAPPSRTTDSPATPPSG